MIGSLSQPTWFTSNRFSKKLQVNLCHILWFFRIITDSNVCSHGINWIQLKTSKHLGKKLQVSLCRALALAALVFASSWSFYKKRETKRLWSPVMVSLLNKEGICATLHWPNFVLRFFPCPQIGQYQLRAVQVLLCLSYLASDSDIYPMLDMWYEIYAEVGKVYHCHGSINWYLISDIQLLGCDIKCMVLDPEV